jgi:hypothetical protein
MLVLSLLHLDIMNLAVVAVEQVLYHDKEVKWCSGVLFKDKKMNVSYKRCFRYHECYVGTTTGTSSGRNPS